jgi:dTDP-4-dehydrorhamnose 3,5-epimerase
VRAEPTEIPGCALVHLTRHTDARGDFVKAFQRDTYAASDLDPAVAELYWSTSVRGVIRGLHFQTPPHAHAKTVTVVSGAIQDVVVDLRTGSPTFGEHVSFLITESEPAAVHVPVGCAHGFQVTSAEAVVAYLVGTEHAPEHDHGIRWDSAGVEWTVPDPIVSERDAALPALADFASPFTFAAGPS